MSIKYSPPTYDTSPPSVRPETTPTLQKIHAYSRRLVASTVAVFRPERHTFSDKTELDAWLNRIATAYSHFEALDNRHDDYRHQDFVTLQDFQNRLNNIQEGIVQPTIRKKLFHHTEQIITHYYQEFPPHSADQEHTQINNKNPLEH